MAELPRSTIMGPAESGIPSHENYQPKLTPGTDKQSWRDEIKYWTANVVACANCGDSREKWIAATLAHKVYMSLEIAKKEDLINTVK